MSSTAANHFDGIPSSEHRAWAQCIDDSLQGVAVSRRSLDGSEDAHTVAGWAMVEQALRAGASALQSLRA